LTAYTTLHLSQFLQFCLQRLKRLLMCSSGIGVCAPECLGFTKGSVRPTTTTTRSRRNGPPLLLLPPLVSFQQRLLQSTALNERQNDPQNQEKDHQEKEDNNLILCQFVKDVGVVVWQRDVFVICPLLGHHGSVSKPDKEKALPPPNCSRKNQL
jgi:hypothetical protein